MRSFAADPEAAFLTARVAVALIGTLVVGLAYWAGARFYERRVGLVAAALMAVAFLPVFYSKHALNDVVTLAPVTLALVGCLLVYERGRWVDWALAGGAVGAATATKYTAGAMLLTWSSPPACGSIALALRLRRREHGDRAELARAPPASRRGRRVRRACSLLLNPYALLNLDEARRQISGQSSQADSAKLGQDDVRGWIYYVGTLGWGFGWVPLAAAVGGAVVALRRDWRRALLLIAFPLFLYLFLGAPGALLRPLAAAGLPDAVRPRRLRHRRARRRGRAAPAARARPCVAGSPRSPARRACSRASTSTRVLGRDRHARAGAALDRRATCPPGARVVVEPFVPGVLARRARAARLPSSARSRPTRSACACARSTATASGATAGSSSAARRRSAD